MHQIPGHEGGIAIRKFVFRSAGALIEIRGSRTHLTNPAGISLWRNGVADMLHRVENTHRTMFYPVFITRNNTASGTAVIRVLPLFILLGGVRVKSFNS